MNVNDIEDVLNLGTILSTHGNEDIAHQPYLLAALLDWKNGGTGTVQLGLTKSEPVAAEEDPEPEPPAPKPVKAAAKAAPAKAPPKSKAKPAPVADDDDADF